ncbi:MAG TPA: hypothetical protein DDX19_27405 [Rhodopirellula baltica]|uniref:Uncharacterized protein n=2 Tax=Rhodopirellula baltica TaxID=265606 RepID=Q7UXL1_RHOBA|nr:hypothetical protein RBWH47_03353 [Rhodopirellula baltica WH47]CAD71995.1 hypothetical protein-transmembrane prediction [Rhodopirellula baltica SH 1]HBE66413.1 hypothetical protein [Rhodopirellula baltica]
MHWIFVLQLVLIAASILLRCWLPSYFGALFGSIVLVRRGLHSSPVVGCNGSRQMPADGF